MQALIRFWYPILVGMLLGVAQMGLFFQLSLTFSSSYTTFLLITLAWLIGSGIGAVTLARYPLKLFLLLMIASYGGVSLVVQANPHQTNFWLIYALFIISIGLYPGAFFGQMERYYPAKILFFRENNGFLIGIVVGTLAFALNGYPALYILPVLLALIVLSVPHTFLSLPPDRLSDDTQTTI